MLEDRNTKIKTAAIWGVGFIVSCFFILMVHSLHVFASPPFQLAIWVLVVFSFFITCTLHFWGYTHVAKRFDSLFLLRSAQVVLAVFVPFGIAVIASFISSALRLEMLKEVWNGIVGISLILFVIPVILFAVALLREYKRLGFEVIAALTFVPAAVAFIWTPWLPAILAAISAHLLYRVSKM